MVSLWCTADQPWCKQGHWMYMKVSPQTSRRGVALRGTVGSLPLPVRRSHCSLLVPFSSLLSASSPLRGCFVSVHRVLCASMFGSTGSRSTLWYNLFESGEWHLFALHASVNHQAPITPTQGTATQVTPATVEGNPHSSDGRGSSREGAPSSTTSFSGGGDEKVDGSSGDVCGPVQWKSVQIDLMSPMGMPPLPSSSQDPGVCLPCEANARAKGGAPNS